MTAKQSESALAKAMQKQLAAQAAVIKSREENREAVEQLELATADVAEKQAAFVASHKVTSE